MMIEETDGGQVGFGYMNFHRSRLHDSPAAFGSQEAGAEQADRRGNLEWDVYRWA